MRYKMTEKQLSLLIHGAGYYPIQTLAKQTTTAQGVEIVYLSLDEDSQR